MICPIHKPTVIQVVALRFGEWWVTTYCDHCRCSQQFTTQGQVAVGDRFRWRSVA